jgi:hypothetical protein
MRRHGRVPGLRTRRWTGPPHARASVVVALLFVLAGPATSDDTSEMWRTADEYIVCGRNYVKTALRPTLEAAQAACSKQLDAYGMAMHTLALNTQVAEGRPLEAARSFAAMKETWARKDALESFSNSVKQWIEERH